MRFYTIEHPAEYALDANDIFVELLDNNVQQAIHKTQERYLAWQEFKHKSWVPKNKERKIWSLVTLQRKFNNQTTLIVDKEERPFTFNPRTHVEFLHQVDLEFGGNFMGIGDFSPGDKERFVRRNLIEESIASSQLEGANTARAAAKKMLQEGRPPNNKSEQMIVNNHNTMRWIEEDLKDEELSLEYLRELHRRITYKTIDPEYQGILRETLDDKGNPLIIQPWDKPVITYIAPDREFVEKHIPKLLDFANDKTSDGFIHPLIKAIMLHFWIGILHPFEDGNGRLARVLFYWYMLKKGYWAFSYISLSERIIKSPKQYSMSYVYTEQDNNDLNYFIYYNISKLKQARQHFKEYITQKIAENRKISDIIKNGYDFNQRQLNLLQYLVKDEQRFTTLNEHLNLNNTIGKVTASADLQKLVFEGYLQKIRRGRNIYYYPTPKIKTLFKNSS